MYAISEHIEYAGVHSGDATLVLPPQRTFIETIRRARRIGTKIAQALSINGPFNIQFMARDNDVEIGDTLCLPKPRSAAEWRT